MLIVHHHRAKSLEVNVDEAPPHEHSKVILKAHLRDELIHMFGQDKLHHDAHYPIRSFVLAHQLILHDDRQHIRDVSEVQQPKEPFEHCQTKLQVHQ